MYKNKKILAIIPARGGSKRIPNKNIKNLAGRPLISYTIQAAGNSKYIDNLVVSSDSEKIIKVAKKYGANCPFKRPISLALDNTPTSPVILHTVNYLETIGSAYDVILTIQPTSPLLSENDIDNAIKNFVNSNANSCVSVCEISERPEWMYKIKKKRLVSILPPQATRRSQYLPIIYRLNGAIYITKKNVLLEQKNIIDNKDLTMYIMSKERSIDIDYIEDFYEAERMLKK